MIRISSRLAVKHLTTLLMLGVLAGCSERVVERQGADITLVPVTQTLTLSVPGRSLEGAEKEIEQFISQNFASIEAKGVSVAWSGSQGKRLFAHAKQYAAQFGLRPDTFTVQQAQLSESDSIRFVLTEYKVVAPVCSYQQVGKFGWNESSCFTDSARWQSMVNPEKMLPGKFYK